MMGGGPVMLPLQLKLALKSGCGVPLHLATHLWYSASCFISLWSPSSLDTILSASPLHPHFVQLGSLSLASATSLPLLWRFSCPTHVPALVLSHCSQQQSRAGCVSWWDASPADPPVCWSAVFTPQAARHPGWEVPRHTSVCTNRTAHCFVHWRAGEVLQEDRTGTKQVAGPWRQARFTFASVGQTLLLPGY